MRAALVVLLDVASQDANTLLATDDQQRVEALPADRPEPALADAFALGARTGVRITSTPVERHTSSKILVNLASRSWITNLHATA